MTAAQSLTLLVPHLLAAPPATVAALVLHASPLEHAHD